MPSFHLLQGLIIQAVGKACTLLPAPSSTKCTEVVATFGPSLLDILLRQMSSSFVCGAIHLCSGNPDSVETLEQPAVPIVPALSKQPELFKQPELPKQPALRGRSRAHRGERGPRRTLPILSPVSFV